MKLRLAYVAIGVFFYLAALIVQLPAGLVYKYAKPHVQKALPGLELSGVGGTVWNGQVAEVRLGGARLGDVNWSLSILPLLFGRVSSHVQLRDGNDYVSAAVHTSLGSPQDISVHQLEGQVEADRLTSFIPYVPVVPTGTVSLLVTDAKLVGAHLLSAKGRVVWRASGLAAPQQLDFGDLTASLEPLGEDKGAKAVLADQGGPLKLGGKFSVDAKGSYVLSARLAAGPNASADLTSGLAMLGRKDPSGNYMLNLSGRY